MSTFISILLGCLIGTILGKIFYSKNTICKICKKETSFYKIAQCDVCFDCVAKKIKELTNLFDNGFIYKGKYKLEIVRMAYTGPEIYKVMIKILDQETNQIYRNGIVIKDIDDLMSRDFNVEINNTIQNVENYKANNP